MSSVPPAKFFEEEETPKRISAIQFTALGAVEMQRQAQFEAVNNFLYTTGQPKLTPTPDSPLDLRLGPLDKQGVCGTCGLKLQDCPGHWAFIKLELPVFNVVYWRQIHQTLQAICKTCARLMISDAAREPFLSRMRNPRCDMLTRGKLLKQLLADCKKGMKECPHCGAVNGTVKKWGPAKLVHEKYSRGKKDDLYAAEVMKLKDELREAIDYNKDIKPHVDKVKEDLTPLRALQLFKMMTPEDVQSLDMDPIDGRPERMIFTHIPIPPNCIRPTVNNDGALGSTEDDLTVKLAEIIHLNRTIRTNFEKGQPPSAVVEAWEFLQIRAGLYINSQMPGLMQAKPPGSGGGGGGGFQKQKPVRSLCTRLKGKHGRFRGNLSGKRVDFTGRTVISPDPNLFVWEVGVPLDMAKILTYPEKVTPNNLEYLRCVVRTGPEGHPGANYVILGSDGAKKFLKFGNRNKIAMDLRVGDTVERHLRDGDIVLFNRQPSLHRISIMAHRAKVFPSKTLRFNECVCTPYNADFDGDEMNIHLPQTEEARAEALALMEVTKNLITPRTGDILVASTQDFLSTGYLLTRRSVFYDRFHFMQVCTYSGDGVERIDMPYPTVLKPKILWTGKQALRIVMRPNNAVQVFLNTEGKSKTFEGFKLDGTEIPFMCPRDGFVCFQNSELMCGTLDKASLGSGSKNCIWHVLMRDYSPRVAAECMSRLAKLSSRWISNLGFSIGIEDVTPSAIVTRKKNEIMRSGNAKCEVNIEQYARGTLPCQPGLNEEQSLEALMLSQLSDVRDEAGKMCLKELHYNNTPLIMALCGSKGSTINISQMVACLGQQAVSGSRIPDGFIRRSLPHFAIDSKEPEAKGFVPNSFYTGLSPSEFFFHTMGGREGLVDGAVKSVTGDTELVIQENGVTKWVRIGDWIDGHLAAEKEKVKHDADPANFNLESLELKQPVHVPTTDAEGKVSWGLIKSVTRHDPGTTVYSVKTAAGKHVVVSASQSLLVWDAETKQVLPKASTLVNVGDLLPVTASLPAPPVSLASFDLTKYLPDYVYPDHASRTTAHLPSHLALDEPNGIFIGLFLSEGSLDVESGSVSITNNDATIRQFVKSWFTDLQINWEEDTRTDHIGGTSSTVRGFSTLLAKFLDITCGHGAAHKHIPDEAFSAPVEFIKGLLNGYFSGDGSVSGNSVDVGSASPRLIDGISMLCTRLGIFGKEAISQMQSNNLGTAAPLPSHRLAIRAQWAHCFAEQITLLDNAKQTKLAVLHPSAEHRNYTAVNDIVLDRVVEINPLNASEYPKLYDLTVPSTYNFGLANGLQVRDTAETGYMQRRLMKALEDLHVHYDSSVRNSENAIIQLVYGEDNLDPSCMEAADKPVNFANLLLHIRNVFPGPTETPLLPIEVAQMIHEYLQNPALAQVTQKFKDDLQDFLTKEAASIAKTREGFGLDPALLHMPSGAKKDDPVLLNLVSKVRKLTITQFYKFVEQCFSKYDRATAEAGTAVGALAGQSLGEPGTQMTLKTFHFAGVASMNVSLGVPRIKEVINATKKIATPVLVANLECPENEITAKVIKARIEQTALGDIAEYIREVVDCNGAYIAIRIDRAVIHTLQLEFNMERALWAIWNNKVIKKLKIKACNVRKFDEDEIHVTPGAGTKSMFFTLQHLKMALPYVVVAGIPGVRRAVITKDEKQKDHPVHRLEIEGQELLSVMGIPGVDGLRTVSNHVMVTEKILGVEAARGSIMEEIMKVMTNHGMAIDARHVMLVADLMTFKGMILGITRFGIAKMKESILMLASFERTNDWLSEGGAHSRLDHIRGVSECVIVGNPIPLGTGLFKLMYQMGTSPNFSRPTLLPK